MVKPRIKVLFDTNILIDYLNGVVEAKQEIARYQQPAISQITWMEVMVGATPTTEPILLSFLGSFQRLAIDDEVASHAVKLRQAHRIKLPDAIVWATAQVHDRILITRNTKDFAENEIGIRVPYKI